MSDNLEQIFTVGIDSWREGVGMMERLFGSVSNSAVFGQPVTQGEHTVITAAEVVLAMGFGAGSGGGADERTESTDDAGREESGAAAGGGGGGGAGGSALSRPVAAISIGPNGVHVEPIVDPTKIALAFFTTLGAFLWMVARMRRAARRAAS